MKKILVDISLANMGYSGIPQDAKWLVKTLIQSGYDVTALIYSRYMNSKMLKNTYKKNSIETVSEILSYCSREYDDNQEEGIRMNDKRWYEVDNFELYEVDKEIFWDMIWRNYFSAGFTLEDEKLLKEKLKIVVCPISNAYLTVRSLVTDIIEPKNTILGRLKQLFRIEDRRSLNEPFLNTEGYDYVIFQDSRPIRLSKGTQGIVRYHDSLPIIFSDCFTNPVIASKFHYFTTLKCIQYGFKYVTNSATVKDILLKLFKKELKKENVTNISYQISDIYKPIGENEEKISESLAKLILANRQSTRLPKMLGINERTQYILGVSTIEPRKNWINWLRGLSRITYENPDVKLVICGTLGWQTKEILEEMKTYNIHSKLIWLENVHPTELKYLYQNALCFVSASYGEGFGLPPIEAQACGCQIVTSNINVYKETQGRNVICFNPHDYNDIYSKVSSVLYVSNSIEKQILLDNIDRGLENAKIYQGDEQRKKWQLLLK